MNFTPDNAQNCRGFSLVEVMMAVFVIALGLLSLFSLFPTGLREGENATGDTITGMFVYEVFSGLRAQASTITNQSDWADIANFRNVMKVPVACVDAVVGGSPVGWDGSECTELRNLIEHTTTTEKTLVYYWKPAGGGDMFNHALRYRLTINDVSGHPNTKSATLYVAAGKGGMYTNYFYTEFYNFGM